MEGTPAQMRILRAITSNQEGDTFAVMKTFYVQAMISIIDYAAHAF